MNAAIKAAVSAAGCGLSLFGCGRPPAAAYPPAPAFHSYVDGRATAWGLSYAGKPAVLVWADAAMGGGSHVGSSGEGDANAPVVRGSAYVSRAGDEVTWECRTADGKPVTLSVGGKEYDLADGSVFLLRTKESPVGVVQLKRDLAGIEVTPVGLRGFAETDPEVSAFLADAGGSGDAAR